ncbi:TPA: efflux transporter outer membrane subunit [Pseudomonas aeruginosa]|uniref:efflux transporter outer membrane subunit n=2 Tax=Pseudomonas aeruginosa TaxID=287 RepID=UPI0008FBBAD1|nr:efflux transporter outer membrane subunit [Pseudomonas aeruginosa]MBI8646318.1 efflux transporter outer membrane subunit [Pseudomonas aeruginosa]HBO3596125.1 efflux transporter outer membrane subunit [Pseudomonas aeruginosa]HBO5402868.1 efflux transporter outer membrane subunit [Pseudomonas aeruginosa]HCE6780074.1 efflux transporter outer membrane subunit [Pseudomonas aeruginosa]HCE7236499.1 efflux transporter outer membrane subunit [Pseudomonas aeruginosa]
MSRHWFTRYALTSMLLVGGCSLQPPYQAPKLDVQARWSNTPSDSQAFQSPRVADWWLQLDDPAINELIASAILDSPNLAQAAARVDEARAALSLSRAQRFPLLTADGSITRGNSQSQSAGGASGSSDPVNITAASLGPSLSWELDLWGRARSVAEASRLRLDARNADAEDALLSLSAQIADGVLNLRACHYSLAIRDQDIVSRQTELTLMRQRLALGNVAPVDEANAISSLASAHTSRLSQQESCTQMENALVALSGRDTGTIRHLMKAADAARETSSTTGNPHQYRSATVIPVAPLVQPRLPAIVLTQHPTVRSAEREVAAAYAEIGAYRAERLPQVDLSLLLAGQWIHVLGSTTYNDTWSVGSALSMPIFDAGAGAANVRGAEARYRGALANLQAALRTATQEVEDALAMQLSARQRLVTSQQSVTAARQVMRSDEARYRLGAISLFELEGARRQLNTTQESAIAAQRDSASAWVALVRASGNSLSNVPVEQTTAPQLNTPHTDKNGSSAQ